MMKRNIELAVLSHSKMGNRVVLLSQNNILFYKEIIQKYTISRKYKSFKLLEYLFNKVHNQHMQKNLINHKNSYFQNINKIFINTKNESNLTLNHQHKQFMTDKIIKQEKKFEIIKPRDISQLINISKHIINHNKQTIKTIKNLELHQKTDIKKERSHLVESINSIDMIHVNKTKTSSSKTETTIHKDTTVENKIQTKKMIEDLIEEKIEKNIQSQKSEEIKEVGVFPGFPEVVAPYFPDTQDRILQIEFLLEMETISSYFQGGRRITLLVLLQRYRT